MQDRSNVQLIVQDTGRGMNQSVLDRLFDPFFTTREDGIGLGMSNVKKIVEAHQGSISVTSIEGEGTKVEIQLPLRSRHGDVADHRR